MTFQTPGRQLVCLTFDFDTLSPWIFRGMTSPTAISRGEFGLIGADRILTLLRQQGIPTTWFIPGHTIETYPCECARVHREGHEVGHHGYLHEPPATLSREDEEAVLLRGIRAIRDLTGAPPAGYRSPSWDLSAHTIELLMKHAFVYDSSMMGHDHLPYLARQGDRFSMDQPAQFGPRTTLVEMPVSWSLDDYPHFEFARSGEALLQGLRRADDVLANWVDDFRYMARTEEWGVLAYTFHPQVIGRGHRMLLLERLITELRQLGAVFVTLARAVDEFKDRSRVPG